MVLTSARKKKTRQVPIFDSKHASPIMILEEEVEETWAEQFFLNPEIWNITSALFMQDMPFLAMRMYVIIERKVINHMLLFFTLKNFIMFCLEIYRILVIALEEEPEDDDSEEGSVDIERGKKVQNGKKWNKM